MKKFRLLALLVCTCMFISACGGNTSNTSNGNAENSSQDTSNSTESGFSGHLEVGELPAEGTKTYDLFVEVGDQMIAENPDLEIEYTFANTKARAFMEQRWRSGNPPDIDYFVFNAQVPSTHEFSEQLLDLTPYFEEDPEWGDSFLDSTKTVTSMDGKTYGIVTDTHVQALYYNKTYFDQYNIAPPETWDDLLAACDTLKNAGIDPIAVTGTYAPYMGAWLDYLMVREVGYETAYEAVRTGTLSEVPGILKAAEKVQTLIDNDYLLQGFEGTDFTAAQMQFFQGKAGMILMGTWLTSEMADSIPEDFNLGICTFPTIPDSSADQTEILSHSNIMSINKNSENLEAAVEFAKRMTSVETQTKRAEEVGLISAVKGVPVPEGTFGLDEVISNAGPMFVRHFGLEFEADLNTAYYNEVAKLFFGEYSASDFIAGADAAMKSLQR